MKSAIHLAGALLLSLFAFTISANAQTGIVKANIPFDFTVGDTQMPAGEYTITSWKSFLVLQTVGHNATVLSFEDDAKSKSGSKLVFHLYGNQYFLHEVICPNGPFLSSEVATGKAEKVARQRAIEAKLPNGGVPTIVTVQ
jgi:hypothetical protein